MLAAEITDERARRGAIAGKLDVFVDITTATRAIEKALALSPPEDQAGWRDIAAAPKDGTEILGWRADAGVLLIRWTSAAEFLTDAELADWTEETAHAENWFMADFVSGDRLEYENEPTHYMPLPAPPPPQDR